MFESWTEQASPEDVGMAWSACAPSGFLAEMLTHESGGTGAERLERVAAWDRIIAWAQAAQLREIAGFATEAAADPEFGDDAEQVHRSVCASIGLVTRVTARTAAHRVHDAMVLAERLPATWRALSAGEITLPAARAVAEETMGLDHEHLPEAQRRILRRAPGQTATQVRASAKQVVARLDAEATRRRAAQARRERSVHLDVEPDGMATLRAYLPAQEAVAAYEVVNDYARRAGDPGKARTMDARRADALVDLLLAVPAPTAEAAPSPNGDGHPSKKPELERSTSSKESPAPEHDTAPDRRAVARSRASAQIRVTVSLTTLLGLDQLPAQLAGYGPIPADVARKLAAEGTWRRLLTEPVTGRLLDMSTTRYRPPPDLAEFVIARDQTCGFPGCRIPAHRCDLDHTTPYDPRERGGRTNAANLRPLSRTHHLLKHSSGWSVVRNADDSLTWAAPTGHRFIRHTPQLGEPDREPPPPVTEPTTDDRSQDDAKPPYPRIPNARTSPDSVDPPPF